MIEIFFTTTGYKIAMMMVMMMMMMVMVMVMIIICYLPPLTFFYKNLRNLLKLDRCWFNHYSLEKGGSVHAT